MLFERWEWVLIVVLLGICAGAFWYSTTQSENTKSEQPVNDYAWEFGDGNVSLGSDPVASFHSEPLSHTGDPYDSHIHVAYDVFPQVTPTLWNDTRRESVGLPEDGCKNNCRKHCTPTPTPTITEACEFPWLCKGGSER